MKRRNESRVLAALLVAACGITVAACADDTEPATSADAQAENSEEADAGQAFCTDMHRAVCEAACDWEERVRACTDQPGGLPAYTCFAERSTGDLWISPYSAPFENIAERFRSCTDTERERALSSPRVRPD